MLAPDAGLKGCAFAHRQAPAATLDPVARPQQLADIRVALNCPPPQGCHFYFARRVTFLSCADSCYQVAGVQIGTLEALSRLGLTLALRIVTGRVIARP